MIVELSIRNFAIIEELSIQFHEGFNVLTGETGAGKSILLDALGLLLGNRGSAEWVRHGEQRAEIEGLFTIEGKPNLYNKLIEMGIECTDGMVVIRRDLNTQGKSICRINGQLVTISMLREVGDLLLNFHSQHDHHQLLQSYRHLFWLDAFGGQELADTLHEYKQLYRKYSKARRELENLTLNEQEMAQRIDLLKYQLEEIQGAGLEISEEEKLVDERNRLIHSEKLSIHVQGAYDAIVMDQKSLDWLGHVMSHLEEVVDLDPFLKEKFEQIESAFYTIEEVARELRNYKDQIEYDEGRLAWIEDRFHLIQGLKRKYGESIMAILEYSAAVEDELEHLENKDVFISDLYDQLRELKEDLLVEANELSRKRKEIGLLLADSVLLELKDLHMENAQFFVQIEDLTNEIHNHTLDIPGGELGMNEVEFLITTNPGEPLKPLAKIASGGELSRIALALRTTLSRLDDVSTLVFDEVDTGVSGRVSQAIGEKLYRISKEYQVLAITHHQQVASLADRHFLVAKETEGGRTTTTVKELSDEERVMELANMVGGVEVSPAAINHAREMLRIAKELKK